MHVRRISGNMYSARALHSTIFLSPTIDFVQGKKNLSDWIFISQSTLVGIALDFLYSIQVQSFPFKLSWDKHRQVRDPKGMKAEVHLLWESLRTIQNPCLCEVLVLELRKRSIKETKSLTSCIGHSFLLVVILCLCLLVSGHILQTQPCCNVQSCAHTAALMLMMGRLTGVIHRWRT